MFPRSHVESIFFLTDRLKALNLVSMEDAVKLSTRMRWLSLWFWCLCVVEYCCAERGDYRLESLVSLQTIICSVPWRRVLETNIIPETRKWKLQWWRDSKNSQENFTRQGYMLSFKGVTLLLREMVTLSISKDVIDKGPALSWCMIHVPESLIILGLKQKELLGVLKLMPNCRKLLIYKHNSTRLSTPVILSFCFT